MPIELKEGDMAVPALPMSLLPGQREQWAVLLALFLIQFNSIDLKV